MKKKEKPALEKKLVENRAESSRYFDQFHDDITNLRKDFMSDFWGSSDAELYDSEDEWTFCPNLELRATKDELLVFAEVPGLTQNQIDIHIDGATLVIRGEKHRKVPSASITLHSECRYGTFQRTIPLPQRPKTDSAKAVCKNGLLQITIPIQKKHTNQKSDSHKKL